MTPSPSAHVQTMSRYYGLQARIYDQTRWMFLFGRRQIVRDLNISEGDRVIEIGCGTGANIEMIRPAVGETGVVVAVDCAAPMIERTEARIRRHGWRNVEVVENEYGSAPIRPGWATAVVFSYSLSMIPGWTSALDCATRELTPGGRIGVVDFSLAWRNLRTRSFVRWMDLNHVHLDRPYTAELARRFEPELERTASGIAGLWSYFRFVGRVRS